jgi:hypothetical protein
MDEGWTRWLLERYGFTFRNIYNAEMIAGGLGDRYDVIVLTDTGRGSIIEGYPKGSIPPRFAGGIGNEGVRALDEFVRNGGSLVCLNNVGNLAIEQLNLPVENVVAGLDRREFYVSGSILEVTVDPSQPVMTGMPERAKVFLARSPIFAVEEGFEGKVLAKHAAFGSPLLSGYLLGPEHLHGYAAALEVEHGDGRVVLLGMKPQWRAQPHGTFPILFNSVLFSRQLAEVAPDNDEFWTPPATHADELQE